MDDLKPCPFCGRKALIVKSWNSGAYVRCSNGYKCGARQEWFDSEKEAVEAWNRRAKQRWIPCSERLPEKCKEVLVCYDFKGHRSVLIGTLYGDESFHGYDDEYLTPEGRKYRKAVAWMPLPEPYKSESEG